MCFKLYQTYLTQRPHKDQNTFSIMNKLRVSYNNSVIIFNRFMVEFYNELQSRR
jgi:hypothetical protein